LSARACKFPALLQGCEFHNQVGGVGHAIHAGLEVWEEKFGTQESLILEIHQKLGITIYRDFLEQKKS